MSELDKENYAHCKSIADELEAFHSGKYFKYNDETYPLYEYDEDFWKKDGYEYKENEVGDMVYVINEEEIEEDDIETVSLYDYFTGDNIYDIKYTVNGGDLSYSGVCLMVTCGGPNIYIDTNTRKVELYWWSDRAYASIDYDVCIAIDEYWEEMYNAMR